MFLVRLNKHYLIAGYVGVLLINLIVCLAYFGASINAGKASNSGVTFGLSILYLVLYTPCSFVFWYRPVYNAFRSVSVATRPPSCNELDAMLMYCLHNPE